ncbi:MAG: hypothetical protein GF331_11195 [Chitinivibrionales bacterium]|nr:hypothetical protein [Chitinivibrionales bacterium]
MRKTIRVRAIAACAMLAIALSANAATISINQSQTHQTIEGLGAFMGIKEVKEKQGPFYITKPLDYQYDTIAYHLGASMMRFEIPPTFFPEEGGAYDPDGSVFGTGTVRNTFEQCRQLLARGVERFIGTVWSPPCWMKYTKECANGGVMDPVNYDRYAEMIKDFAIMFRDSVGVELYGISYANEPQFTEPYNSCIWGDDALNTIITKGKQQLNAAGLSSRVYAAEHMFWAKIGPYTNTSQNPALHAFAVHGYSDGVSVDYGTASDWESFYGTVSGRGKKLWMTETTCNVSFIQTAKNLHTSLKSGKVSAWTWWAYGDNLCQGDDQPKDCFYGSKHYFRFVRPGAQQVSASSDRTGLWATAFKHTQDNTVTVVLINNNSGSENVTVNGVGSTTFSRYQSAGTQRVALVGTVTGGQSFSVPGNSVTTLYSGEIPSPVANNQGRAGTLSLALDAGAAVSVRLLTLTGRTIAVFPVNNGTVETLVAARARELGLPKGTFLTSITTTDGRQVTSSRAMLTH